MFEIFEGDLPIVRTRRALLVLDLQNDLVSTGGILPVDKPTDFLDNIVNLVPKYRAAGSVIWVRTQYETNRPVNDEGANAERVITDRQLVENSTDNGNSGKRQRTPSKSLLKLYDKMLASSLLEDSEADILEPEGESVEPFDNETYLTIPPGKKPLCLLPLSLGANYTQVIANLIDLSKDLFFTKTHYSAFKSGALLQTLRGQFVTELYICGALTNISVFATAMDAARFGYAITLVENCLGYRSKARHDEAIRQLVETAGCDVMSSAEVVDEITPRLKGPSRNQSSNTSKPGPEPSDDRNLLSMIKNLKVRNEARPITKTDVSPPDKVMAPSTVPEASISNKSSKSTPKDGDSHESPKPISISKDDSFSDRPPLPTRPPIDAKKRVPNKIKSRRRPSKPNLKDTEQQASGSQPSNALKAPHSPTQKTLTSATEVLEKISELTPIDKEEAPEKAMAEPKGPSAVKIADMEKKEELVPDTELKMNETARIEAPDNYNLADNLAQSHGGNAPPLASQPDDNTDGFSICEGDSKIIHGLLLEPEVNGIFERVRDEVQWQKMSHQGGEVPRLVAVQGEIGEDGSIPIYRHPSDESPPLLSFSPAVSIIRSEVEKKLGHKVNHCLIQFYRTGTDYISEHSDKTLDIAPDSFIANVSLGALRIMTFRTKKPLKDKQAVSNGENAPRLSCKAPLPHNSMCKMGLHTNMKWLHSIRQDKRRAAEKSEAELSYDGGRISLTFRLIGTFLDRSETIIWGQGAVAKEKKEARSIINGDTTDAEKMLFAFGKENHSSNFDWQESYGEGFDVLHISNTRKLILSGDNIRDLRVKLGLAELGIAWVAGGLSPFFSWKVGKAETKTVEVSEVLPIRFIDNDIARAKVQGDTAILLYLDAIHGSSMDSKSPTQKARQFTRLLEADALLQKWRAETLTDELLRSHLAVWEMYASEDAFIANSTPSLADYAFWPVLRAILQERGTDTKYPHLQTYHERMMARKTVKGLLQPLKSEA